MWEAAAETLTGQGGGGHTEDLCGARTPLTQTWPPQTRSLHCARHQEEAIQGSAAWGSLRGRKCPTGPSVWSHGSHVATEHLRCDRGERGRTFYVSFSSHLSLHVYVWLVAAGLRAPPEASAPGNCGLTECPVPFSWGRPA